MTNSADLASCESADIQRRILELIEDASSIAISGHTSPDGDAWAPCWVWASRL